MLHATLKPAQRDYTKKDHQMWQTLLEKQTINLQDKVNPVFLHNWRKFNLPSQRIPLLNEISERLYAATKWKVEPVLGLIGYETYFSLLKNRRFPVADFIREESELELSKDPDIFHEVFGHCTMLLSQDYADFMSEFGKFALTISSEDRPMFARLIWFTTETGLIQYERQIKIYGSSIISSYKESLYCLQNQVIHKPFDVISIFREPYRADILQNVYYVLEQAQQIYNLLADTSYLFKLLKKARLLGEHPALFPVVKSKYCNAGHCCPVEIALN